MSEKFTELNSKHRAFIGAQHMYFVGTAAEQSTVNVSPKGMDSFRIIDDNKIAWLNLTGSGNESAAHVLQSPRMTVMFCSFDRQPLILRLYGEARVVHPRDCDWESLSGLFPAQVGARQIFELQVNMVQTSCGFSIPLYHFEDDRKTLEKWADKKGAQGVSDYWMANNRRSLDDLDTGIV
ncbi:MAG: hypothetical protein ACI9WS_000969 [Paraglaciecola psychrophila]|jgi:hypothetical protein